MPRATQVSGSSATWTGIWVASATRRSRPGSSAPPPARTMPWSMMSATSSGGVSSIVSLIVSTICCDRHLDRLADLVGADLDRARQAGQQVAAAERDALLVPLARVGGADRDLDVLGRALAEEQVVLAPGERDDVLVHLVAADADRRG